jgi:hypothetical protein
VADKPGLSRRQMIKASAVAGAAAWTAPVIIDSLSSPAAAGSMPCAPGTPNLSYGIIIYQIGTTFYAVKIAGNTCSAENGTGGDGTGDAVFTCGNLSFTNPQGATVVNGTTTTVGNCAYITTNATSGANVFLTAAGITAGASIVAAYVHDGSIKPNHIGCFFCASNPNCASICAGGTG